MSSSGGQCQKISVSFKVSQEGRQELIRVTIKIVKSGGQFHKISVRSQKEKTILGHNNNWNYQVLSQFDLNILFKMVVLAGNMEF